MDRAATFIRSLVSLFIVLLLVGTAADDARAALTVTNQAAATFDLPGPVPDAVSSNTVTATVQATVPVVSFYTDNGFSATTDIGQISGTLYPQVSAGGCNFSSTVIETKIITITSAVTGDTESYAAIETGADTGIFRVVAGVPTRDSALFTPLSGNGLLETAKNDVMTASVTGCGALSTQAIILIDPAGVVFDSRTNAAVANATVTLIDVTGAGNGNPAVAGAPCTAGTPGGPAKVQNNNATAILPSTVITAANGRYDFPLVCQSTYRLSVTPPTGYIFPSTVPQASLPAGRIINATASYGGNAIVNLATGPLLVDVPLDPLATGFFIRKTASKEYAEVADAVDYTVTLTNLSGVLLTGMTLSDMLPAGFKFVPGSVRLDGNRLSDPLGGKGPALSFTLGTLAAGASATLTYRTEIGPGAIKGTGINRAQAFAAGDVVSNTTSARVKIQGGVFSDKGYIIGKVFLDCNRNRQQDQEEPGIPGVRLYLEDGTFVITDSEGKFDLYGITPRTHVLKLDETTMPVGSELIALGNRNAFDAGSRFIDLKNAELHKADFAEGSCSPQVLKQVSARRKQGEVQVAETEKSALASLSADANPRQVQDARTLPSSGYAGGEARSVPFAPVLQSTPAGDLDHRALAAQTVNLERELAGLDASPGFVDLKDGDTLPMQQANLRVKGTAGSRLKLRVNNEDIPEARVGTRVISANGTVEAWEYIGVELRPGRNLLQLTLIDPFGNTRGEKAITVIAPDKLGRISITPPDQDLIADGQTAVKLRLRLTDQNGVPVTARTPVTLEASLGRWRVEDLDAKENGIQTFIEGGSAEVVLLPPPEPGEAVLRISSGMLRDEVKVSFLPDLRPMIAAGLIEGVLNLRRPDAGTIRGTQPEDGFEKELREFSMSTDDGRITGNARTALFLKGKIKGEYLLTVGYDSDKDTKERLFRDIQPDEFYPVYGDSAVKGFDAQSSGKLYVRIDKKRSYLLYGDFSTQALSEVRQLSAYNRSLNGVKEHYENRFISADLFASEDSTRQVVEELPALGISGPYYLSPGDRVVNSERVEIITRDRNQPGLVIKTVPLVRFADYEIDSFFGTILLKAPALSLDRDLNPNFIRVTYEVEEGGRRFWVTGVDAQAKVHDRIEIGGVYVKDNNPLDHAVLEGANATVKLADKTYLIGEWAETDKDTTGIGTAKRVELRHDDGGLQARLQAARSDLSFDNAASSLGKGRFEGSGKFSYKFSEATLLRGDVVRTEDDVTKGCRDGALLNMEHSFSTNVRGELGARYARETATPAGTGTIGITPFEYTSVRTKLSAQMPWNPKIGLFGGYEQAMGGDEGKIAELGGDYQFSNKGRIYARHEFISSLAGDYALNSTQQQNVSQVGIETGYMKDGHLFSEYRMRDASSGRESEAAVGLRNAWYPANGVKLSAGLERITSLSGPTDNTSTAVTSGVEYTANPLWKGSTRLEYRTSETSDTLLNTIAVAYKFNRNVTLLGRNIASATDVTGLAGDKMLERIQAGLAYRPTDSNRWNALGRYEHKYESDEYTLGSVTRRNVDILSAHLNYQPVRSFTVSGHYAVKQATEAANSVRSSSSAHLVAVRTLYDITSRWDAGLMASVLFAGDSGSAVYGLGAEAGYLIAANLWISAGYNVFGFKDRDLANEDYTTPGAFIRLRFKFDETLFSGRDSGVNKTLVPATEAVQNR